MAKSMLLMPSSPQNDEEGAEPDADPGVGAGVAIDDEVVGGDPVAGDGAAIDGGATGGDSVAGGGACCTCCQRPRADAKAEPKSDG